MLAVAAAPSLTDTYRRALMEHEIHHTQQCNFWGLLMGALPLQGLLSFLYGDIKEAFGDEDPGWINELERDAQGRPITRVDNRIPDNPYPYTQEPLAKLCDVLCW